MLTLNEWSLDPNFPADKRFVDVSIHLKYVDLKSISQFEPKERKMMINKDQKEKFDKLIQTNLFDDYVIIGTSRSPRGIKTRIAFSTLNLIESLYFVNNIFINKIDGAKKKRQKNILSFYCVKITVAIEVEGIVNGLQYIEDRFVIVKAKSFEDAYLKLEKNKYSEPYLNCDGRFVRDRIESFDDCYQTDVCNLTDFNNPEGVEVYSKFRSRRMTNERIWDGKVS